MASNNAVRHPNHSATSANVADVTMTGYLVRDADKRVYGDAGYTGIWKYPNEEKDDPDFRCCVAAKRGTLKKMEDSPVETLLLAIEKAKASIRAKVEHPFHVIKNLFGYRKVRYRGWPRTRRSCSPCSPLATWCWQEGVRGMLTGLVYLEFGLAAGKLGCQEKQAT